MSFKMYVTKYFNKIGKPYFQAIEWLWDNRAIARNYEVFEYPTYGGLPKKISNKLSSGVVDVIQEIWYELLGCKNKKQFYRVARDWMVSI